MQTYQVQVVLHHVELKSLDRKRAVAHALDKVVVRKCFPYLFHIGAFEEVVDEAATATTGDKVKSSDRDRGADRTLYVDWWEWGRAAVLTGGKAGCSVSGNG